MIDGNDVAPLLASYVRDAGVVAVLYIDETGRVTSVEGAWAELLGSRSTVTGSLAFDHFGEAWDLMQTASDNAWLAQSAVWRAPDGSQRALDCRCRRAGATLVVVAAPGLWVEEKGLREMSRLHEQLVTVTRDLHRRNRQIQEAHAKLEAIAWKDPLTGLANRRQLGDTLDRAVSYAKRHGELLSVVAADLDHFKAINDRFGHAAGDRVLEAFARVLDGATRREDLAARVGGEEFLLVLPGTSAQGAAVVAERVRSLIAARVVAPLQAPVTTSLGVAVFRPEDTASTLWERADQMLYAAKGGGRNRVVVES